MNYNFDIIKELVLTSIQPAYRTKNYVKTIHIVSVRAFPALWDTSEILSVSYIINNNKIVDVTFIGNTDYEKLFHQKFNDKLEQLIKDD